jgi:hypothetical protein
VDCTAIGKKRKLVLPASAAGLTELGYGPYGKYDPVTDVTLNYLYFGVCYVLY